MYDVLRIDEQIVSANMEKKSQDKEGQLVLVENEYNLSSNSVTPNINITTIGDQILDQILENMNPLNALPGIHPTANKGFSLQGVTSRKFAGVGLNTSYHEVPSNEMFDRSIQPTHNQDTLSMMSSVIKKSKRRDKLRK